MSPARKKLVLITGCSPGGIGHSLALEFHRHNYHVLATARNTASITSLSDLGITTLALELTNGVSILKLKAEVERICKENGGGGLDFLVNNAGRNYTVPAVHVEMDEIRETFESNVFGVMRLCQIFTPVLIEAKGTIVQIGSLAGIIPYVFGSVYGATKAALHSYSDTLRVELAPFGVRVVTVVTGGVKSNIARTHRALPEDSIYLPVKEDYERRLTHSQAEGIPNEQYAKSVVSQLLRHPRRDTIWEGGRSWLVKFISTFFPRWVFVSCDSVVPIQLDTLSADVSTQDIAMTRMFKLWKLRAGTKAVKAD